MLTLLEWRRAIWGPDADGAGAIVPGSGTPHKEEIKRRSIFFKPLNERVPVHEKPFTLLQEVVLEGAHTATSNAGRVEQRHAPSLQLEFERRGHDRDAALLLELHPVGRCVPAGFVASDGAGQLNRTGIQQQPGS